MKDMDLRRDIMDELELEPRLNAASIGVAVVDGVVTLTGHVPSFSEKLTIEKVVGRVNGVRGIAQEIDVRYPGAGRLADDEIAKRALQVLGWDATVPDEAIKVTVDKGLVSLSGEVASNFQRDAAEREVSRMGGVTGVVNRITIKPPTDTADIRKKIKDALKRHAEVEAEAIRVNVIGDKATLEGNVDNWDERIAVRKAAWSAPGIRIVEDRLRIGPAALADDVRPD